jgi:hypothetical protein
MKTHPITNSLTRITFAAVLLVLPPAAHAQGWRLVGITGQQGVDSLSNPEDPNSFIYPDHTLYEINQTTGALTKIMVMTFVNDSQAIGYCPADGRLYHTGGSESYSDNPFRTGSDNGGPDISGVGYQDSHYMESVDLATGVATGVFNACPCPNPDPLLPCFGLSAPRPDWVLPLERRTSEQTDGSFRARGEHEYHAVRGMAWSTSQNLFYITDEFGIFKLTATGDCTFLAQPAFISDGAAGESKAIAFVTNGDTTKLYVGHRNGFGANGLLMEIDEEFGTAIGEIQLTYPPGGGLPVDQFGGLLGLVQHPVTRVLYGIRKTDDNFGRELVTIDLVTGETALVGNMGLHIASIAFVPTSVPPVFAITSVTSNGNERTLTWTGGTPPYQVQTSPDLTSNSWTNIGPQVNGTTTTVTVGSVRAFIRIAGQ